MTSTNDGKDVKSNQTSGHKGKTYYIDLYKSLEKHLSEECELRERTQHLCEAWRRVHSLCTHSAPTTHPHYLAWLQRHTANTLLQSEWQSEKDEHKKLEDAINAFIEESKAAAASRSGHSPAWESQLLQRGEWFKSILENPWGHPVLKVLCDPRSKPPTDEEILEWLKEERGVMFVTRLRHLAASRKCHEIALSLASAVLTRARAADVLVPDADQADDSEPLRPEGSPPTFRDVLRTEAGFTVDVWELITDLELVLLHKRDEHAQCIALAKKIPLRSGYQLVERLRSRPETSPREKKLWKNAGEVATLVAQVLVTRCMVVPACGGAVRSALYCCARSLVRLVPAPRLPGAAVALAAPAATARHLHTLAAAVHTQLHAQNAQNMNSFVCELYVRAITAGMNELEKLKIKTEKEAEARIMEQTLASWFTSLGSLLSASARIQCECALTAFSVHPSPAMYDKIKLAPPLPKILVENLEPKEETKSEFGSWANDSRGQTNLVKTSETLNLKQTQQHTNVMSTAIFAQGEAIGLSAELCQDLTVCLSGPRVKTLSWDMDREVLLENCQKYMARTHGGTRALTTELKYLNLDPSQYQHLPEEDDDENDVYYGIEKGYEHLVELQEEASWEDAFLDTETAYSSCMEDDAPQRRKKKTKTRLPTSEDDSDPLSTLTEVGKKKERPHSKERSKERKKKPKDPEKTDNKEKKKRERKKKPKEPPGGKPGSLASLIGVKIARANEIAITDSDYDSQGKSSLASEGNDPNVIFDGVYSMDHKSPDKVDPLSNKTPLNHAVSATNGVPALTKPKRKPSANKRKPKVNVNVPIDGKPPTLPARNVNSILKPDPKPVRPTSVGVVSEHVKRSITKLLQFRRNQNAGLSHKNLTKTEQRIANAIYKPDFPVQPFVTPKSVVVPEIPKSYINKANLEKLEMSYYKADELAEHPSLTRFDNTSHNRVNEVVRPASTSSAAHVSSPHYKDIMNVQNYYQNMNLNHQPQTSRSIASDQNRVQPKNISMSLTRVETSRAQVSEHEKSYENFLRELKMSINAGTGSNPLSSPTAPVLKKDFKPTIRSPLMPSSSTSDLTSQYAKQVPQKKVENAPNTFSRLSYMHKNKQSDIKQKQALETQANRQDELNKQAAASLDLSRSISEFKNTKIKYVQTKGNTVITRVDNPLNLSCDNTVRKTDKSPPTSRNYPLISSMLQPAQSTSIPQSPVARNNVTATKVSSPPGTSYLSEKDQNDLVLLLQQRNRINAAGAVPRLANPQNVPINMTTSSNTLATTNDLGKSTQNPTVLNNNLQQYEIQGSTTEAKPGQFEAKPGTVINFSKSANQKQDRSKKVSTTKPKPCVRKERTKSTHLESNTLDWESVMNAIRAQKTPSRGPSALELALNKDSDNNLRNQRIVRTNSVGQLDNVQAAVDAVIKHTNNVKPATSMDMPILTTTTSDEVKTQNNTQLDIQNKPLEIKKAVKNVTPKRVSGSVDKKQIIRNKFAVSMSNNKDDDPFIHGRDDDYNLSDLDDLLDDELRRELGELSSDEDAYRIPHVQKGIKITYNKSNIANKLSFKGKSPEAKYLPNTTSSSSGQLRPTEETPALNSLYPKSRETSVVRSQVNTKKKSPVQTCLLNQSVNKAPCSESINKNVLRKEPQQVGDLSSRSSTASHTIVNNVTKEKVASSTLHYKYLNTVNSNISINKDMNKGAVNNQTPAPSLPNQFVGATNVNNNVYVVENEPVIQVAVPAANVVLFGSEMYYNPNLQTQLGPGLCTMNQTYVQQTAPNIALYQTANFVAPVVQQASFVAPVITRVVPENTVNVPVTSSLPVSQPTTIEVTSEPCFTATPSVPCEDEPCMADSSQPIVIKECPIPRHIEQATIDTTSDLHNEATFDINSNKNSEGKKILDIQENQSDEALKLPRHRAVSTEEVLRDILNDQEKDHTIASNVLINPAVKNLMNDQREPNSMNDSERLKRKRLAILNREIVRSSAHPPIALSYSPIFQPDTDEKIPAGQMDSNKKVVSKEIVSALQGDESNDIDQKMADVIDFIAQDVNATPVLKADGPSKQTNDENSKENTNSTVQCRRILLRSSNKNLPKIQTNANDQNPVGRKTKVRLKAVKTVPVLDANKPAKVSDKKVTHNGIYNHKTIAKNNKRKAVASKNTALSPSDVPAAAGDVSALEDTADSIIDELCKNVTEPLISDNFDIEEALLGAKIPNSPAIDPLSTPVDSPDVVVNEESHVIAKAEAKAAAFEPDEEIMNIIGISNKDKPDKPVENTFQNVFETAAVTKSTADTKGAADTKKPKQPSKISNISKTIADLIEQIKKGDVLEDEKANKDKVVEPPSTITGIEKIPILVPDTNPKRSVSNSNMVKGADEKAALMPDKNSIPQSYKDSIIIEEIPNDKAASNVSKLLRVKLPNGKVYKASVYGKMHTSFDSLFDDPSLRAMLMSNFNEQKKYTLNIKQVSTPNSGNPNKPIDTVIQEIQVKSSSMKPAVVETINLLSDDEESDDNCTFKTKCGVYKTTLKDKDIIAKHQAKFDQICSVSLERRPLPKTDVSPVDKLKNSDVIEIDEDSDNDNLDETLPPVILDNKNETKEQSVNEVIEIDDESSNDSIDLLKTCPNLPVALIVDVPVKPKVTGADVTNEQNIVRPRNNENRQSEENTNSQLCDKSLKSSLDCYVSLRKCDDLVKKLKNDEYVDPGEELDTSFDTSDAEMSSNASISILNDFALHSDKHLEELSDDGRSSPVIGIFEVIASLQKSDADKIKIADATCQSEWLSTKRQICYEHNLIDAEKLHATESHIEEYSVDGRSSPVIEVFEVIASLRTNYIAEKETKSSSVCNDINCQSDWLSTKRDMRKNYIFIGTQIDLKKKIQCPQLDDLSSIKKPVSALSTPSLVSIMSLFFQKSSILDHLKPLTKNGTTQIKRRKSSSISNLKRKMQILPDNIVVNKISKYGLKENANVIIKVVDKCDDNNDKDILRISDNCIYEKSDIQNNSECAVNPALASSYYQEICKSKDITSELTSENDISIYDGDKNDRLSSCESHQMDSRMDCDKSPNDNNEVSLSSSNMVESSCYTKLGASGTSLHLEDNIITEDVVLDSSRNQSEEITDMEDEQNENSLSDNSLTSEEIIETAEMVPGTLSSQDKLVSNKNNTDSREVSQEVDNVTANDTIDTVGLSEENVITEGKETDIYEVKAMTAVVINDTTERVLSPDRQFDDAYDMKADENDEGSVKDLPQDEVSTLMEEVLKEITSNKDQQIGIREDRQGDNNVITTENDETPKDKVTKDVIADKQDVLDDIVFRQDTEDICDSDDVQIGDNVEPQLVTSSKEVDGAEQNSLEAVMPSKFQQQDITTTSEGLQNAKVFTTGSGDHVESEFENKVTKEVGKVIQSEEAVNLLQQSHKLNNTVKMDIMQSDNITSNDVVPNDVELQIAACLKKIIDGSDIVEADMESGQSERDDKMTAIKMVQDGNSISIDITPEGVESQSEERDMTEIVDKQDIEEAALVSNPNNQINETTEITETRYESVSTEVKTRCDVPEIEDNSIEEDAYETNIDPTILSLEQQIIDITGNTCDSHSHIETSGSDDRQQDIEIPEITDEFMNNQDIEEDKSVSNKHIDATMEIKSHPNVCVTPDFKSNETTFKVAVEVSLDNSDNAVEHDDTKESIVETLTKDEIIIATRHLEEDEKRIKILANLVDEISVTIPGEELLTTENQTDEIPIVMEKFGSELDDDTITIIEVADQSSGTKLDMEVEVIVEREEKELDNENIELVHCDSTTDSKSDGIIPDSTTHPNIEVTCEDTRSHDNDSIETPGIEPEIESSNVNDPEALVHENVPRDCLLRGIEFQDPDVGTLYVLYPIEDSGSDTATLNDSCDTPETLEEVEEEVVNSSTGSIPDDEALQVNVPKVTYSKLLEEDFEFKKNLKRKMVSDSKFTTKRYRKGKNIDYPKITAAAIIEQGYTKEYKRVFDYSSSLKFSYTQPFHKDYLDVDETIKDWPIKGPCLAHPQLATGSDVNIFTETEINPNYEPVPMEQSLEEEINQDYSEISEPSSDINETNFNMGFGEGSGRVIQNLEDVGDISKVSAATLSDVKHPQPFLLSEHCEVESSNENAAKDQLQNIQRYLSYIKLREKVKSFFHKSAIELKCDILDQKKKESATNGVLDSATFPFDLCMGDFIEPYPFDPIVQVVQVGQLPVSAAAQNPVTCDPRVTQVSDASPSQCSVDNSPQDDSSTPIKTEYTELTTADLTLPLVHEYTHHTQTMPMASHENSNVPMSGENIPIETEIKSMIKIELEELEEKEEPTDISENNDMESMTFNHNNDYSYNANNAAPDTLDVKYEPEDLPPTPYPQNEPPAPMEHDNMQMMFNSTEEDKKETPPDDFSQQKQNGAPEKTDQIAHAMSAAGITTTAETIANNRAQALVNMINQKIRQNSVGGNTQTTANSYSKTTSINAMALQQALAQILPPPLNQTNATDNNQQTANTPQVLHIVQGKNASGSQITLVDNSQQSVISGTNATPVLHIVQNKAGTPGVTANGAPGTQNNSFGGLSLVDAGLQQGGNQLLHIVNTGNQKNSNAGQLLKRVNLLTNLTNVQGSNEQKMVQFVCKSADGKSIQLNAPHQRSMVLRLQPIETPAQAKTENQDPNQSPSAANSKDAASQQEIKSRSIYEENYAKFIQNAGTKPAAAAEKSTSLPKFNQAFVGKPVFQEGTQKSNDMNSNNMQPVNTPTENNECPPNENAINLEHIGQISSPPLLLRKTQAQTSQAQTNLVQQIKQTIAPMNIQTMHGGVIYTRQIPVNIGGGQTINLITVPSTELIDESGQKQQSNNQGEIEPSIIKIVPQSPSTNNTEMTEDSNANMGSSNENNQNPQPQPQPVLTQMRIKLPMLSKTPQMVGGTRVVRPSFFQIQRNVIGGNNQPVYQQLVLTAAPPLGQQTIRLPTANRTQIKVPTESQSSTESMSSSTLEQLREFDMVLEQVKERSTVQPNSASTTTFPKLHTPSSDTSDNAVSAPATPTEQTQVLYSIGNNQQLNVAYVNRKATVTTPTTSNFVRSPDSSGVADSPTSSTHVRMSHTAASEGTSNEVALAQPKPAKVGGSKSKSRPKSSSHPHNAIAKINPVPAKTSTQKPLEDEQTTQRILYILAEYKEQVENSPDKDKPAPRRRSNPPSNPGSSKRKKSSSGSRRICGRDMSPVHGDETSRTMGSEDSSCGTSQGDCNESCLDSHSPQDSPRKIVRKLTYEPENAVQQQPRPQPQRNVIVADGQTITVARGAAGKPATAVLMPANYILPVSMVKGGQQIAIVTNRGPKLLTVGGGEGGATNALLLQRLIGPGGLKPMLARPGVRHVRLPTAALHNLQAFNLATATTVQPPDSTASPAPAPTPPELVETRAASSPWTNRESEDVKPERGSSPEGSEPWNLPSSADPHDYTYEETVRADNMDRTVLDPIPDRYSPDMEAQRIFDKMFDVDSKKSYITDSPRCGYDIDASDCDDKAYQVVHKKDGTSQRHHRLAHVSAAALRHKYAILEHELRLQKSLSEECEDLGVDSPSASELFPEAELLFAASPAHDHNQEPGHQSHTPQPTILNQSSIPQPDMDDQIATDQLLPREDVDRQHLELGLEDVGIVSVGAHGMQAIALDHEEFARAHPNTTFHTDEPTDDEPVPPFAIAGLKGRHITSTIFHSNRAPATVLMTAPQTTVISQASAEPVQNVKYADIDNMINSLPSTHNNINLSSVLVKDDGLTRFDNILNDTRELHLSNTASAIVHSTGNATQVIRRVCYDDKRDRDASFLMDEPDAIIAGDDAKMIAEDSSRDATLESMADVDDDRSSPERHAELFWESNSASERSEGRRPLDFSSDSDKCCKSPSYDETNSTDSSGVGTHMRLDSVIKEARGIERSGSADGSSADDAHPPLRTYPPKRPYHPLDDAERSVSGKTRAGERSPDPEVRRRASGRGVVKRGCHCCNGSPAPPRPKKPRQRKPATDFAN